MISRRKIKLSSYVWILFGISLGKLISVGSFCNVLSFEKSKKHPSKLMPCSLSFWIVELFVVKFWGEIKESSTFIVDIESIITVATSVVNCEESF